MSAKRYHALTQLSIALTAALFSTGCHHQQGASKNFQGGQGSVAVVDSDVVTLELPVVKVEKGTIFVSGTVRRKPGVPGDLPGRVDIEFLGAEGEYLDGLPALLTPRAVPLDSETVATYSTSYGFIPPAGSVVRVHFVDHVTQVEEDLEQNGYGYGGGSGKAVGGAPAGLEHTGGGAGHHGTPGSGGGYGSGFGTSKY